MVRLEMNIQLPDGRVVYDVPDDTSRQDFVARANRNGMNIPADAQLSIMRTMSGGPSPETRSASKTATSLALQYGLPIAGMELSGIGAPAGIGMAAQALRTGAGAALGGLGERQIRKQVLGERDVPPESVKQSAVDFATGGLSVPAGRILGGVARKMLAFGADEGPQAANELLKTKGLTGLLPDEMRAGGLRRYIGNLARNAPLGSEELRTYLTDRSKEWGTALRDTAKSMAPSITATVAGNDAVDTLDAMQKAFHGVADVGYDEIKAAADPKNLTALEGAISPDTKVGGVAFKDLDPELKKALGSTEIEGGAKIPLADVREKANKLIEQLSSMKYPIPGALNEIANSLGDTWFSRAKDWRTALRALSRDANLKNLSNVKTGAIQQTLGSLDSAMTKGLDDFDKTGQLSKELRIVDGMYARGREIFYNQVTDDIVKATAKQGPEMVAAKVFRPAGMAERVTPAIAGRQALTGEGLDELGKSVVGSQYEQAILSKIAEYKEALPSEAYNELKGVWMDYMLRQASGDNGIPNATKFVKVLNHYGPNVLQEAFGKPQVDDLMKMAEAMIFGESHGGGTGRFVVGNRQLISTAVMAGLGIGGLAAQGSPKTRWASPYMLGGSALFLGGPYVVGRLWTSPITRKLLLRGLTTPATTSYGARLISQLGAAAYLARNEQADNAPDTQEEPKP